MKSLNQSLEIEQRILENLMHFESHTNERVQSAILKLNSDCFYNFEMKQLFAMIKSQFVKQESFGMVDILVLIDSSDNLLHEAFAAIMDNYRNFHVSERTLESDIDKVILMSRLRKQTLIAERMLNDVKNCLNPHDAQQILIEKINDISNLTYRESKIGISNAEMAEAYFNGDLKEDLKIPTAWEELNQALDGGIMPKSLIIVAAGSSVGKTGFSIFLMDSIARMQPDRHSLFFSIEMEAQQIWLRHAGIKGGKHFENLSSDEKFAAIASSLEVPVKFYDVTMSSAVSDIEFILTTARLKAMEKPISVIVVDYLGLVTNNGNFERNDLKQSDVTTKLAQLAIELNCTVIALSQINRGASARATDDRCPWPHDAADSSGGHRSASLWFGVDRPELYQDDPCYRNQFVTKCRKNRFGNTFELNLAFNLGTFAEVQQGHFRKPAPKNKNVEKALFNSQYRSD